MSYLVLARKYRPQTFDEVVGQDHVSTTLKNAITADRVAHAMLFTGPRGTGKTTIARILAKALNCTDNESEPYQPCNKCQSCLEITSGHDVDVFEIDGASNNSVEQVRELRENITYRPVHSRFKIYIIDEVHMLSLAAFNALLKTLEEPPSHVKFLFATTDPQKIPVTILSRCQRHDLRRVRLNSVIDHMANLCEKERVTVEKQSLELIGFESGGSLRDALSLLDQVLSCSGDSVDHDLVVDLLGIFDRKILFELSSSILKRDIENILNIIETLHRKGNDFVKLYNAIIAHIRNMLVVKLSGGSDALVEVPQYEIDQLLSQVKNVSHTYLTQILDILINEESHLKYASSPKIAFEMIFIKLFQISPAVSIDELIRKVDALKGNIVVGEVKNEPPRSEKKEVQKEIKELVKAERKAENKPQTSQIKERYNDTLGYDRNWEVFLKVVSREHPSLSPSLSKSTLKNVTEKSIEVALSGTGFNIKRVQEPRTVKIIENALTGFFDKEMRFVVKAEEKSVGKTGKERRVDNLKQTISSSSPVTDIMEIFNGKIVDLKIKEN